MASPFLESLRASLRALGFDPEVVDPGGALEHALNPWRPRRS
jgi:hypothetical protein